MDAFVMEELSSDIAAGMVGAFTAIMAIFYVVLLLVCLLQLADVFFYKKLGNHGWESLVPVYNDYVLFRSAGMLRTGVRYLLVEAGMLAAALLMLLDTPLTLLFALIEIGLAIYMLVLYIKLCSRLSKKLGHGGAFTFGLVLFPIIPKTMVCVQAIREELDAAEAALEQD